MTEDKTDSRRNLIDEPISAEKAEALAKFRSRYFRTLVERRLREAAADEARRPVLRRVSWPIWAASLILLVVAGVFVSRALRPAPGFDQPTAVMRFLELLPGIRNIDVRPAGPIGESEKSSAGPGRSIAAALWDLEERASASRSPGPGRSGIFPAGSLSLEETYRILFIEKSVERVLMRTAS